jgi:hypothetical protein
MTLYLHFIGPKIDRCNDQVRGCIVEYGRVTSLLWAFMMSMEVVLPSIGNRVRSLKENWGLLLAVVTHSAFR